MCLRCGAETETVQHVLQCNQPEATDKWNRVLWDLGTWMTNKVKTKPSMAAVITKELENWRSQRVTQETADATLREAIDDQKTIGWWQMIMGLHSNRWQIIQQAHYDSIGSKRSAKRWTSLVIHKLWNVTWDMWQH